jgi:ubiquinone/menaquinone biosynthesis C-methylase UbiE
MVISLSQNNRRYWQKYKPGQIPSVPKDPPQALLKGVKTILDVGTGDGVLAEKLANKGYEVFAIDIAENIIAENQKRKTGVKYSAQTITDKTDFKSEMFDLIIFRFTLTNIHKDSWLKTGNEINRLLKPGGKVWVLEPLVSDSYDERYKLASNFIKDKYCVYVFFDKELAEKINNKQDLEKAIKENKVSRVVKHYTIEELKVIFDNLELIDNRVVKITSPSGFVINTFEGIFLKIK